MLPPLLAWLLLPAETELLDEDAAAEDDVAAGVGVAVAVLVDEVAAEELAAGDEVLVVPLLGVEAALFDVALSAAVELAACCANSPSPTALVATTPPTASLTLDINPMLFMAQLCGCGLARCFESSVRIL